MFGAAIASAINCFWYRISRGESWITGRSHCDICGHDLDFVSLIPVFGCLIRRGRCKYCGAVFGYKHALIEGGLGLSLVVIYYISFIVSTLYCVLLCFITFFTFLAIVSLISANVD